MDIREITEDPEEIFRTAVAGLLKNTWTALPTIVSQDSDGHTVVHSPTVKRKVTDPDTGDVTYEEHPHYPDGVVHYPSGGGHSFTHPVTNADEGVSLFMARNIDNWRQSGGAQNPVDNRMHSIGDSVYLPGVRSDPRKLQQVSADSAQVRSDDKRHVHEVSSTSGVKSKSVDPGTAPASQDYDPFKQADTFFEHLVHPTGGVAGNATSGGTTHSHGVTHDGGAFMTATNALHSVLCHPSDGASMNAQNGTHSVLASPSIGAMLSGNKGKSIVQALMSVLLQSSSGIKLDCPPGGLSLPAGGVSSSSLASGAAASNVGTLGGDLAGTLPNPQVVGLGHVDAHLLPVATSDAAAAAAGVPVGGLYLNTSFALGGSYTVSGGSVSVPSSGIAVLCVRLV